MTYFNTIHKITGLLRKLVKLNKPVFIPVIAGNDQTPLFKRNSKSMKKTLPTFKLIMVIIGLLFSSFLSAQIEVSSNKNFSQIGAGANDDIYVDNGATLTMDVNGSCQNIFLGSQDNNQGNGTLKFNSGITLTVGDDVTLGDPTDPTYKGSLNMSAGGILKFGGEFTAPSLAPNGFTPGTGTIQYNAGWDPAKNELFQIILSTQALGGAGHEYYNLTISSSNNNTPYVKKTLDHTSTGGVTVTNVLTVSSPAILDLGSANDIITLKSTATRTAQLAAVTGTISYSGAGKFIVERYVAGHRAWRFMGIPITTTNAPTIKASWMEGGQVTTMGGTSNPNPGYGTHITGPGAVANGLDVNPAGNPSAKYYNLGLYPGVPNSSSLITSQPAYMLFVRGSRANVLTSGVYAATDNTTLRISGQLNTGNQVLTGSIITPESNPYASRIAMPHFFDGGIIPVTYSVWDPLLTGSNGVGAFVTYSWGGSSWSQSVAPVSPIQAGIVESGAAFLLQFTPLGQLTLHETDKTSGSAQVFNPTTAPGEQIRANLYTINNDGTTPLVDGALVTYDNSFSNGIDYNDALKNTTFAENLGILRNGQTLAIERRSVITGSDSIFLNMTQMNQKSYQLEIVADNLDHPGMAGILHDNFLGTLTPLNLNGTTTINFTVTADAASSAADRFNITFNTTGPLPVQYTNVKAYRRATDIAVEWTVDNELNMQQYVVEHSADGRNFSTTATALPTGNNNSHVTYTAADASSFSGDNFYRVKGVNVNGRVQYTPIVKVASLKTGAGITVYPNPITGNVINLQFIGQSAGTYNVRLYNADGQMVYSNPIMVNGGNSVQALPVNQQLAKGVYQLEVKNGAEVKMSQKVIVQ